MKNKLTWIAIVVPALTASFMIAGSAAGQDATPSSNPWSGAFIGLNAGGAFGSSPTTLDASYDVGEPFFTRQNIDAINASGFTGGIGAGYNFSSGPFVLGAEADFNYLGAKGRDVDEFTFPSFQNEVATQYHWLGTVRGKIGIANDKWLGYATGGLAVGSFEDYIGGREAVSGDSQEYGGGTQTSVGYVLGAGAEYAVTERVSIKAEYMFADLGKSTLDVNKAFGGDWFSDGTTVTESYVNATHKLNIIRVGVNFRF